MKQFKLTISSSLGYLELNGAKAQLTEVSTQFIANSTDELKAAVKGFISEVSVMYMINTDIKHESSASYQDTFSAVLRAFHLIPDLWDEPKSWAGTLQWFVQLEQKEIPDSRR